MRSSRPSPTLSGDMIRSRAGTGGRFAASCHVAGVSRSYLPPGHSASEAYCVQSGANRVDGDENGAIVRPLGFTPLTYPVLCLYALSRNPQCYLALSPGYVTAL